MFITLPHSLHAYCLDLFPPPLNCSPSHSWIVNRVAGMHICTNAASPSFVTTFPESQNYHPCFVSNKLKLFKWSMNANPNFTISISKNLKSLRMLIGKWDKQIKQEDIYHFSELSLAKMKTLLLFEIFLIFSSMCSAERIQVNKL